MLSYFFPELIKFAGQIITEIEGRQREIILLERFNCMKTKSPEAMNSFSNLKGLKKVQRVVVPVMLQLSQWNS